MATQEHLKESLEHFKQQRQVKLDELRMIEIMIRGLQQQVGEIPEQQLEGGSLEMPPALAFLQVKQPPRQEKPAGENYKPRPDEFFSLSIADAAKAFLEKVGHAMSVDDILRVITSGGCKVGGADPKRTLSITLSMAKREFVSTGSGNYGLRKFYPNMPKLGRPEGTPSVPKKKVRAKAKKKGSVSAKRDGSQNVKVDPHEVNAAIVEALRNRELNADELLAAVVRKVGPVKKIAVYGALRKKEFEQIGDKYRLRHLPEEGRAVVQ